jgi:hypothetical protein
MSEFILDKYNYHVYSLIDICMPYKKASTYPMTREAFHPHDTILPGDCCLARMQAYTPSILY